MRNLLFLFLSFVFTIYTGDLGAQNSPKIDAILSQLDDIIENKATYHARLESELSELKLQLNVARNDLDKNRIYSELFSGYLHFQADSALHYVDMRTSLSTRLNDPDLKSEIIINRAEVMGVMGMYNETLLELDKIDPQTLSLSVRGYYYRTYRAYYGWISDYTVDSRAKVKYCDLADKYRDSVLLVEPVEMNRRIIEVEKLITQYRYSDALKILDSYSKTTTDTKQIAYINYNYALIYEAKEDFESAIYHLAKTAIVDLEMATREYASLQHLAQRLYAQGDLDRSYEYLSCSMEDAVASNASLRSMEVSKYYPIIDRAYKQQEKKQIAATQKLLVSVSALAIILIVFAIYLMYGIKRLSLMRHNLYVTNESLIAVNMRLAEAGRIKEVYIARYLERCVTYLDKLDIYRRSLKRLASASKIDELRKALQSEQMLHKERKEFYVEFDRSFLTLFPHFVEDFNMLLKSDAQVLQKVEGQLNTELRIFALIRLGITDAPQIAHFLGYSLATVYSYRSKMRNRAVIDKDKFEPKVMTL